MEEIKLDYARVPSEEQKTEKKKKWTRRLRRIGLAATVLLGTNEFACNKIFPNVNNYFPLWTFRQHDLGHIVGIKYGRDTVGLSWEIGSSGRKVLSLERITEKKESELYRWYYTFP